MSIKATVLTQKGQIAIPAEIRKKLKLKAGNMLEFKLVGDEIRMRPVITVPREQAYFWTPE